MELLKEQLNELTSKVGDIHKVIAGQPEYGQKGIKDTLDDHGQRLSKLETTESKKQWKAGAIGGGVGGIIGVVFPKTWIAKLIAWMPF